MTELKGKIVAHHKTWIPHPTETGQQRDPNGEKFPVRLDVAQSKFHMDLPDFIGPALRDLEGLERVKIWGFYTSNPKVVASVLDDVKGAFDRIMTAYTLWRDNNQAEKVLAVFFACNSLHAEFGSIHRTILNGQEFRQLSGEGSPAIHLHYLVGYKLGERVFAKTKHGTFGSLGTRHEPDFTIPWTEEREKTLTRAVASIEQAISLVASFVAAGRENPVEALAALGASHLALPAPDALPDNGGPDKLEE